MLEILSAARPYLEAFSFISTALLVFGLAATYKQAQLIKEDMDLTGSRSAKEKAIEASSRYLDRYVDLSNALFEAFERKGIGRYKGTIGDFNQDTLKYNRMLDYFRKNDVKPSDEILTCTTKALNELEAIAAFFVTGVANEKTGFEIIGRTYCNTVEGNYDLITGVRSTKSHAYYNNIVSLYRLWQPRLSQSEITASITELEMRLSTISRSNNASNQRR